MQIALCTECTWRRIQRPDYLCSWVDLKKYYMEKYKRGGNLRTCVETAGENLDNVCWPVLLSRVGVIHL